MGTKALFLKIASYLSGLLILVSLGFNVYQYQRNNKLSVESAPVKIFKNESVNDPKIDSKSSPVKVVLKGEVEKNNTGNINELEENLNATEQEIDETNEQLSEELTKKAEFKKAYARYSKNMASNPAYKKSLDRTAKRILQEYDPLFKKLNLTPEEINEFKAIQADRMEEIQNAVLPNSLTASEEERAEMNKKMMAVNIEYRNRIVEFLGKENLEIYDSYRQSLSERSNLNYFMETVPPDIRISEEQTETLIDTMYRERKAVFEEMGPEMDMNSSANLTEENITHQMEITKRVYDKYAEAVRGVLPAEQAEQYKSFLKKNLEGTESMMKTRMLMMKNK